MSVRVLFVDGGAGASGDMILGALVDLGLPVARLRRALSALPVEGWSLRSRRVVRQGLAARKIDVRVERDAPHRGWKQISRIVRAAGLEPVVRERALEVFRRLIEAEAEVHGVPVDRAHLHEVGAVDAIVDVVGACFGLHHLGVERVVVSPLTTGHGSVRCVHGVYPVPAPATLLLLRGCPIEAGDVAVERLTPTGAAILTTLADAWGPMPALRPLGVGYGAGSRELDDHPNCLRVVLGIGPAEQAAPGGGEVLVLETTLDDVAPQTLAHACERLLEAGALDVFTAPVTMKKGRSGHAITVLGRPDQLEALTAGLILETSTLGLRYRVERRVELPRTLERVRTPWGEVPVKVGRWGEHEVRAWPEHDACAAIARRHDVPLARVRDAAIEAHRALRAQARVRKERGSVKRNKR